MLGTIFALLCIIATVGGIFLGNGSALGGAVLDGASGAVSLTLSLCGMMSLWCGVMRVLADAGAIRRLSRLLRPLLRLLFPDAARRGEGLEEISGSVSANLLGIGNASTPLGLAAMKRLQASNPTPHIASRDMITLAVMNTAGLNLLPTTILALRRGAGSENPYTVLLPIWVSSLATCTLALLLCRLLGSPLRGGHRG